MHEQAVKRSPQYAKLSHASAISLGLMGGRMYRGAVNKCVNLLVHYPEGCAANCAYCGLAKKRPGSYEEKSFIHVEWPIYHMSEIIEAINQAPSYVKRTCISMITNGKCRKDTITMTRQLKEKTSLPISILISPTILKENDLWEMKEAGADKIGIAIDLATPELFDQYRGKGVNGPHKWDTYWKVLAWALKIFGTPNVGAHLMVGMGETEEQMVSLMDKLWNMGVVSHLFSFFAEEGSRLADRPQPPWPTYLRVQLARYLIEENLSKYKEMAFDQMGRIVGFGLSRKELDEIIDLGRPFMTTGCLGDDGEVACNRPFGNCLPDVKQWNYPYPPNEEELALIREHIFTYPEI
ncbi:MAG: radical SAM protein [Deltaproteobacteria bacterium]|nr:radical SAM protein [Deltaproteobacteria bacterium]MBW1928852.1 radical SAM protein [Deltaproteobacteria bacterium]MBW2026589.1 radical SAM protein [Deltaproteobacteria bacterium]MBW2126742.1 radical SAM protein [Deltaproteobacteria bacterium]